MTTADETVVRPLTAGDYELWEPLWRGYLQFYGKRTPQEVTDFTWKRLTETTEIHGILAVGPSGEALGIAQFVFHPATASISYNCYLSDLFVGPSTRRRGIASRLIAAVADAARANGCALVYWQTEEFNGPARRLYERVAKRSPFIRYNFEL